MRVAAGAAALLALVAASGCGGGEEVSGDPTLTVYVSAPLSGPDAREGQAVADGAKAELAGAGGEAAGVAVEVVVLDTGPDTGGDDPAPAGEDLVRAAAAARQATQDSTAIAYIGELDSAATLTSLPITNDARLLQVSTGAGDVELVAPFEGSDEVPPDTQTTGVAYVRDARRPRWRPGGAGGGGDGARAGRHRPGG